MTRKEFNYNIFKIYLPAFTGLFIFFYFCLPENLSSADDAYSFSRLIRDEDIRLLISPRYALFLPLSKIGFQSLQLLGIEIDAHRYLTLQSMFAGSAAVLLVHYLCHSVLGFGKVKSVCISLLLLFSWAFWRYSVEAEVYAPSITILLVYIILIIKLSKVSEITYNQLVILSLTGMLSVLYYKPNALPVLVCLPLILYSRQNGIRWSVTLSGLTFIMVLVAMYILSNAVDDISYKEFLFGGTTLTPGRWLSSIMVVLSNLISFLWVFGIPGAESWAVKIWPNKVLSEEIYLKEAIILPSSIILILLLVLGGVVIYRIFQNRILIQEMLKLTWVRVFLIWILAYAAMLIYFDPSSSEPWIMIQLPVILLLGSVLMTSGQSQTNWISYFILVLFFSINLLGGVLLIRDKTYDYIYLRGQNIADKVTDNDIIITFGPKTMEEYLTYHYPARVLNLEENFEKGLELLNKGYDRGRIFLLDDVLRPNRAITYRMNKDTGLPARIVQKNYVLDTLKNQNEFSVYQLRKRVK